MDILKVVFISLYQLEEVIIMTTQDIKNYPKPMPLPLMVFWTGLFGGLFWSTIGFIAYFFHFTEIRPNVLLEPWLLGKWKYAWQGTVVSIIILGILSVAVAFIYYALFKKLNSWWYGLGYGILLFLIVFFLINPLIPGIKPIVDLKRDTIITSVCLYIIYGIFIGYSINYEYQNKKFEQKEAAT
jgi:hypothetical protein